MCYFHLYKAWYTNHDIVNDVHFANLKPIKIQKTK